MASTVASHSGPDGAEEPNGHEIQSAQTDSREDNGETSKTGETGETGDANTSKPTTTFFSLPVETQRQIFEQCSSSNDLVCLALVCKHFHSLASEKLYRHFRISFPDDDEPFLDSPIDSLASGLETFATSEYNYAKHVREIFLDTFCAGDKGERAYKDYLYSQSCGKFLNTLLLLALRKTTSLETFRWNVRIELSRPVWKQLHKIESLKHLHVRLQLGPSHFEPPPPLPHGSDSDSDDSDDWQPTTSVPPPLSHGIGSSSVFPTAYPSTGPGPSSGLGLGPGPATSSLPPLPKLFDPRPKRKAPVFDEPPTLSGFKKLTSLSVLDIDSLDVVTELKSCVRNSSLTLRKLKLSFSTHLALEARKPRADSDPVDIDPEDDFQPIPMPPSPSSDGASMPVKVFRAREERKLHESVLGRILETEPYRVKKPEKKADGTKGTNGKEKEENSGSPDETRTSAQAFMGNLKKVSEQLLGETEDGARDPEKSAEILELIRKATTKYLESDDSKDGPETKKGKTKSAENKASGAGSSSSAAAIALARARAGKDVIPEDIDIEAPSETEDSAEALADPDPKSTTDEEDKPTSTDTSAAPPAAASASTGPEPPQSSDPTDLPPQDARLKSILKVQRTNFKTVVSRLKTLEDEADTVRTKLHKMIDQAAKIEDVREMEERVQNYAMEIKRAQRELDTVCREIQDAARQGGVDVSEEEREYARVCEYIRSTRGLPLRSFSVHLIPLKSNVLKKAVDLRLLQRLTLLNVGAQNPIWSMLNAENKKAALPLCKVSTDNACPQFLTCMANLDKLEELFMIERADNYKPEPFEDRSELKIGQIRRAILKKHVPTLRKLMIKNDRDTSWDVDDKTTMLICWRAAELEELAVSMSVPTMHTLMRNLPGLKKLYALNIIHYRSDDTCPWAMRETRHFLIDTIWHHPELKLEWLCIDDDRVEQIVRKSKKAETKVSGDEGEGEGEGEGDDTEKAAAAKNKKKKKQKKKKGKGKAGANGVVSSSSLSYAIGGTTYPSLPAHEDWDRSSSSDEDDEDGDGGGGGGLGSEDRLHCYMGLSFSEAVGVKIFKKEIIAGCL